MPSVCIGFVWLLTQPESNFGAPLSSLKRANPKVRVHFCRLFAFTSLFCLINFHSFLMVFFLSPFHSAFLRCLPPPPIWRLITTTDSVAVALSSCFIATFLLHKQTHRQHSSQAKGYVHVCKCFSLGGICQPIPPSTFAARLCTL